METIENTSGCPAIDQFIESSSKILDNGRKVYHLKWIPFSEFTDVDSIEHSANNQHTHYATYERAKSSKYIEMLPLGTRDKCTQEFITEFARIHSLPTHKYDNPS